MINPVDFYNELKSIEIEFFTGVPDSLLKDFCAVVTEKTEANRNIIAANEGNAIALASGYHLATGKIPLVYMQNSGIGNAVNPLISLADQEVYSIPMLLLIGWRGEPGIKDELQHIKQGRITIDLLNAMKINHNILPDDADKTKSILSRISIEVKETKKPFALIVKKNTFSKYSLSKKINNDTRISREDAIKCIVDYLDEEDIVVSTTGKISRELFEYRTEKNQSHKSDFLTVGSMGHANQIALGIALEKKNRNVFCFDGDGAVLMHTGGMGIIGDYSPENYKHIIFNNGSHESVGGQPTIGNKISFGKIAEGFNYKNTFSVSTIEDLREAILKIKNISGPVLLEVKTSVSSRDNLGRPTSTPIENKEQFIKFLSK